MFAGQGFGLVLQAAYFVVLARLLSSREYGIYVGATSLVTIVSQYGALGFGTILLRYVSSDRTKFSVYWGNILLATAGTSALLIGALRIMAAHLLNAESANLVVLIGISECLCNSIAVCSGQVFQAFERLQYTAALNLSTSPLRLTAALTLLFTVRHATALQWTEQALGVSVFALVAAIWTVSVNFGPPQFSLTLLRNRLAEGIQFSVSGSTTSMYNDLDKTMLSHYGMNTANGIYTVAYRLVDIATLPIRSLMMAAVPRLFRLGSQGIGATVPFVVKVLKRTSVLGALSAVALCLISPMVPWIAGSSFSQSASAVRWLSLIPFFRSFHLSSGDALTGAGYQKFRLGSQVLAAGLNFGLNLWLIPAFGWAGAASASLATDGLLGAMNWFVLLLLRKRESTANDAVPLPQTLNGPYLVSYAKSNL